MTLREPIYVCRPQLPKAEAILEYVKGIDALRYYTNRGPLVHRLETRMATRMDKPVHTVKTASSGTAALEVAILAHAGLATPEKPLALVPSLTFAATGLAVERCGFRAFFADIDPETWALDPEALAKHPRLSEVGLIVAVAPYGRLPDIAKFEALQAETGIPVVIDAAAAFEQVVRAPAPVSSKLPMSLSLHATKTFSTGEGGAVIWDNPEGQDKVVQVANFGFFKSRECKVAGTNAKMSEYHAAIGLAMLDEFADRERGYAAVASSYTRAAANCDLGGQLHLPPVLSSAYALLETNTSDGFLKAEAHLKTKKIETRRWYELGQHAQPHFRKDEADPLTVTDDLSARLLGLPMGHDLSGQDVGYIVSALADAAA